MDTNIHKEVRHISLFFLRFLVVEGGYDNKKTICIEEFEDWLHETEIWQCLTDLEKDKQGPAIYLSLNEKIRKTCSNIKVKDLNNEDGVDILIKKLTSLFSKDANQATYFA